MTQSSETLLDDAKKIRWTLHELFESISDPKIETYLKASQTAAEKFCTQYKTQLATLTPAELNAAYEALENLLTPLYQVSQYANLVYSIDTSDDAVKALVDRVDTLESEISNQIVFFSLELAAMPEADFKKFDSAPELKNYAYSLYITRKNAQYNLSELEEKMINLKNLAGPTVLKKLYEELTSSFEFEFEVEGVTQKMNGSELRALRYHPDPETRRKAMALFFKKYESEQVTITHIFNGIFKDYQIEKDLRGYKSPIQRMNVHNDLDDQVVQVLHQVTSDSNSLVHRYYRLKAKILQLPDLTLADIYAPMPESQAHYSFKEASQIVLDGFSQFDDEFYRFAKRMFDENRIDAPVLPNKRGGAYCSSSIPNLAPYVLLNFLGKDRDISTLAHELGHAVHAMYSAGQTLFNYHSILPLAETASVFSEMLITDLLLKLKPDKASQIALLTHKLEDIFATSYRQNMFSQFEQKAHAAIANGRVSTPEFCKLYQGELQKMFGDSVRYTPEYQWEWASIPHMIEVPFYVYAYNFGNLLVMALYQSYLENGKAFIPAYKKMLSMGSSCRPTDITAIVGADISQPAFWQKSIRYIEHLLERLEGCAASV